MQTTIYEPLMTNLLLEEIFCCLGFEMIH